MPKYNHAFDFAFEIMSEDEFADDVTPGMLREALIRRAISLSDDELDEACGLFDTYEMEV